MGIQHSRHGVRQSPAGLQRFKEKTETGPQVMGDYVYIHGEQFYRVKNSHLLEPFFMSLISAGDLWMFIASNGALTAGRIDCDSALFPYYSSDKIVDLVESIGPTTVIQFESVKDGKTRLLNWRPFSKLGNKFKTAQNVYKNASGSKIIFEELNHDEKLLFRYSWTTSERYGFVRDCQLVNLAEDKLEIRLLDGLRNILPGGIPSDFQLRFSNLGDAYKKNELLPEGQTAVYYLSSVPTDRAEPSEGLVASVVYQLGLNNPKILLADSQLDDFLIGKSLETEFEKRGKRGAYYVSCVELLTPHKELAWQLVAEVNLDQTDVNNLILAKSSSDFARNLSEDISISKSSLHDIVSACDGVQAGRSDLRCNRHLANVTFNAMRGGVPLRNYEVCKTDLKKHISIHNPQIAGSLGDWFENLPEPLSLVELREAARENGSLDLIRICDEYIPLWFGRRHGDPTRPWNYFNVTVRDEDGEKKLHYEGNWRDLFQNWEALGVSYPKMLPSMVLKFANASTVDGYNPYRVSKSGFDWEVPDPHDPWSNIGYWCDHQIIYWLKLIERARAADPECLDDALVASNCVFADVPYRIKNYEDIVKDSYETITYDFESAKVIEQRVEKFGVDGKLVPQNREQVATFEPLRVSLFEKLLLSGLTKIANLIPGAGVWLNTQRPEWNDANNALVGRGASIVTVCYLKRYFDYLSSWIGDQDVALPVTAELRQFYDCVSETLASMSGAIDDSKRRGIVDQLQECSAQYRASVYSDTRGETTSIDAKEFAKFANICVEVLDATIASNLRDDDLYHSYNLVAFEDNSIRVDHLPLMLEGQVAVLTSESLSPDQVVALLDALRQSDLYREDQSSYILYPNKDLGTFLDKNILPAESIKSSKLLCKMVEIGNESIVRKDEFGSYHFAGVLKNSVDVRNALRSVGDAELTSLVDDEMESICQLFEATFEHHKFTGRSSTFFAYEGLGSIYWHMVSKLVLAIQDCYISAKTKSDANADRLAAHYVEARDGLGLGKSPSVYGAIPTDPYSHTPESRGAQQPGMTGQVKEDILSRFAELGVRMNQGQISFETSLFDRDELVEASRVLEFNNLNGELESLTLSPGQFAFTLCQVPVIYEVGEGGIEVEMLNGDRMNVEGFALSEETSNQLMGRTGEIARILVRLR